MSKVVIAGAILGAGLVSGGMLIQSGLWREADASPPASARLLDQVMARVQSDWVDTISTDELLRRAASGLVKEVDDPYSSLLTADRLRRLRESTTGRYAGVGLELDIRDGFLMVIAPIAGTPADSAGVKPGDRITSIDGKPTVGWTMEEAQQRMRGPSGSVVKLTLERGTEETTVTLKRREIVFHPVQRSALLPGSVGYVELATFNERAAVEVRRTVDSLRTLGARALILDMRENPGGLLEQGIAVADLFLDQNLTIASTRGRVPESNQEYDDTAPQLWPTTPVVVLVDSGTASAAEIVAGALQDHDRAAVVGWRTYGKGSAQSIFPVAEGRALKLTTARWFTPDGRTIERDSTKGGITPDVEIKQPATRGLPISPATTTPDLLSDPAIARALELLQGVTTPAQLRGKVPRSKS